MPSFMEMCSCKGRRPEKVATRRQWSRPNLIAGLLKDRRVARFVVAPAGFGKSSLVLEYADVVFSFQGVTWVKASSPCFLRDLDAGVLSRAALEDDGLRLLVCEDVPRLDPERSQAFGDLVDALLEKGVEVIATCAPSADTFAGAQHDRLLLRGSDLLLDDEEMAVEESSGRISRGWERAVPPSERIACLLWSDGGRDLLLAGLRREELTVDVKLLMVLLLAFGEGSLDDVRPFVGEGRFEEVASIVSRDYPFFGIDERSHAFKTATFRLEDVAGVLRSWVDDAAATERTDRRGSLHLRIADALLARRGGERACSFMRLFALKEDSSSWLKMHGWDLVANGDAFSFAVLHDDVCARSSACQSLSVVRAWASFLLGDEAEAFSRAYRLARTSSLSGWEGLSAAVLSTMASSGASRDRAFEVLEARFRSVCAGDEGREGGMRFDWSDPARVIRAARLGARDALACWLDCARREGARGPAAASAPSLLLAAGWLVACFSRQAGKDAWPFEDLDDEGRVVFRRFVRVVLEFVDEVCSTAPADEFSLYAVRSLDALRGQMPDAFGLLSEEALSSISAAERRRVRQCDSYRSTCSAEEKRRRGFADAHPDRFRMRKASLEDAKVEKAVVPQLFVSLFGGVEVRIGDDVVDPRALSRQKTKVLLTLLVINRGRELSRDRLAELLWPDSGIEAARKNFYSVWSQLKRALRVDGEKDCPYLQSSQNGCKIDARFLASDVLSLEGLCRSLLFGSFDTGDWERVYAQVCNEFGDDLLPSEHDNDAVRTARELYRTQLVDALVSASAHLNGRGEARGALWFAREALRRDSAREDVYVALMEAQIASEQRAPALETYFACRRFLSDELGIDPSLRIVELYRSIIESEETIA